MPEEYAYRGTANAQDPANEFNTHQYLIDQGISNINTATAVKVVKVTNEPGQLGPIGRVDVQPLVNQLDGYGNATEHEVIHGLAYIRTQGGNNAIIIDPQVGDTGLVVFADRDISGVKTNQDKSNPGSKRRFDMSDGIFVGMCLSKGQPNQYVRFTNDGVEVGDKNGNKIMMSSSGIDLNPT